MFSSSPAPVSRVRAIATALREKPLLTGALAMFLLLAVVYAFSIDIRASRGAAITGDEPFYLLTTQSLIQDGDLDLRQQYEAESYRDFFDHPDGLWMQFVPTEDGRFLSPHNPGLSVFLLPGFALGGLLGAQVQLLLTAALTFALTFVLVARITGAIVAAWLGTLAVSLSATSFVYSTEIYPEVPAALAIVTALLAASGRERPGSLAAVAVAVGLTAVAWLGVKYVPLGLLVGVYFLVRAQAPGRATLVALAAPGAAFYVWFHLHTFGELTPYSVNTVYAGSSTAEVIDSHVDFGDRFYRLWGLFIDRRFGIGRWAPVLLLALPGMLALVRRPGLERVVIGLIAAQVLMATFVAITMMGWWFPGRTLMTVLPLTALPLAALLQRGSRLAHVAATALGCYSVTLTAALAYAGHTREIFVAVNPFDLQAGVFRATSHLFPQYTSWSTETWVLTVCWLAIAAAGLLAAVRPRGNNWKLMYSRDCARSPSLSR